VDHQDDDDLPRREDADLPVEWHVTDEDRGWIVCQIANRMEDPGDGGVHEASNLTILHYAGEGLWSYEEDVYNPAHFLNMIQGWCRRADELGNLPNDASAWMEAVANSSGPSRDERGDSNDGWIGSSQE
jgi:hypothetical protein